MPLSVIDPPEATRLDHELDLRRRGYVPVSSPDALFPAYKGLLPRCSVRQVLPQPGHSRLVWSHPGRSGIDPRAVAPLAVIRVADGLGSDPLDEPLALVAASTWLLDGDVLRWLLRPEHRVLVGASGTRCLLHRDGRTTRCLTHVVENELLQDVATALGDGSMASCRLGKGASVTDYVWKGAVEDLADLLWSALCVTGRLAGWYRHGITGTAAWDLARHGVRAELLDEWVRAGFSVQQAAAWCSHGDPETCARLRSSGQAPVVPFQPVPLPVVDPKRGLSGFDRWQYSRRRWPFGPCALCGASAPTGKRCRTCERQDRTTLLRRADWAAYQQLEELGELYTPGHVGGPVACGATKCPTPLALSAVDEGARQ